MSKTYDLHASIGYQATLFSRITERRFEAALTPLGLTRVLWTVLLAAGQEGLKMPSEIAEFVGIDRTATSRALRRLEATGLVTRKSEGPDKRARQVILTEIGRKALADANAAAAENAAHFAAKLTWYETSTLSEILTKLMTGETRDIDAL